MAIRTLKTRRGFTLVEALAVVAIIGFLIAILVPAINSARVAAKRTASKATINTLEVGLETFRTQQELGTKYPPSRSDLRIGSGTNQQSSIASPFRNALDQHPAGVNNIEISGAGLLYAALAGFDGLGTAGFRPTGEETWGGSLGDNFRSGNPELSGLYALDNDKQPVHRRYGPFVDLQSVAATQWDTTRLKFAVPAEERVAPDQVQRRDYPMFLDAFGAPVLYWRADSAGRRAVDGVADSVSANERGIYHFQDNGALLASRYATSNHRVLQLRVDEAQPGEDEHLLDQAVGEIDVDDRPEDVLVQDNSWSAAQDDAFLRHILDRGVTARLQPQKADSYILLSPGPDMIFGTQDDIGNIAPNGGWK